MIEISISRYKIFLFIKEKKLMKRLFKDLKKYKSYILYSAKSELKSEVAGSYLNWLWWILNPLCFMLIYLFISEVVFGSKEEYFPIFVFLGLTLWDFFSKSVLAGTKILKKNKSIIVKVYFPKIILVINKMLVNGFKMLVSCGIILILLAVYRVPITWKIIYIFPVCFILVLITFGCSVIAMHCGAFVNDFYNVINILLRFQFYLTGIFYSIEDRVPYPYNYLMLKCNPIAYLIYCIRQSLLYGGNIEIHMLIIWLLGGVFISALAIRLVYKYENSYVKVL